MCVRQHSAERPAAVTPLHLSRFQLSMHPGCLQGGDLLHVLLFSITALLPFGRAGSNPAAAQDLAICCVRSLGEQCLASSVRVLFIWPLWWARAGWAKDLALLFRIVQAFQPLIRNAVAHIESSGHWRDPVTDKQRCSCAE